MSISAHIGKKTKGDIHEELQEFFKKFPKSKCCQIFTHGPRHKYVNKINIEALAETKQTIYTHSTYMTSWKKDKKHTEHIEHQFKIANQIGAAGVVIHLPKDTIANIVAHIPNIINEGGAKLLLENRSIRPSGEMSHETPEKMIALIEALKKAGYGSDQIGFIIDTAHIYIGYAPIREKDSAAAFLAKLDDYADWFPMLHLNGNVYDAKVRAGDKHTLPFAADDKIWNGLTYKKSGCKVFIDWYLKKGSDIILEVDHTLPGVKSFLNAVQKNKK